MSYYLCYEIQETILHSKYYLSNFLTFLIRPMTHLVMTSHILKLFYQELLFLLHFVTQVKLHGNFAGVTAYG